MSAHKLRLAISDRAKTDVQDALQYSIERWGSDQATADEEAIDRALEAFRLQPRLGKRRDELVPGLRSHRIQRHTDFYRVVDDMLYVHRILHQQMDVRSDRLN